MERRQTAERREVHLFVGDERREGPHDRRSSGKKHVDREREQAKIERIRAFKEKDKAASQETPRFSKKRLIYLGVALLIILVALFLIN